MALKIIKEEALKNVTKYSVMAILGMIGYLILNILEVLNPLWDKLIPELQNKTLVNLLGLSIIVIFIMSIYLAWLLFHKSSNKSTNELKPKFGVYWDKEGNPFCPNCKKLLGSPSAKGYAFNCKICKIYVQLIDNKTMDEIPLTYAVKNLPF